MNSILYCRHWAQTVAFYRDKVGFPVSFESDWFVEFQVSETAFLSVADERRSRIKSAAGAGLTLTLRTRDADAVHAQLESVGIELGPLRNHSWGARLFHFHDPEGHRLEVWSPSR